MAESVSPVPLVPTALALVKVTWMVHVPRASTAPREVPIQGVFSVLPITIVLWEVPVQSAVHLTVL